jgi:hypothetical protein
MVSIEQYSFDHILTHEKWEELNSEDVDNGVRLANRIKIRELFQDNLESSFHNFLSETGIKEDEKGVIAETYRKQSREVKRQYRTYRELIDNCLYDYIDDTSSKILDLWEEDDKMYYQSLVAHFYYMSSTYAHITDMLPMYQKYKKHVEYMSKLSEVKKIPLNWFQWYFDQEHQNSFYK